MLSFSRWKARTGKARIVHEGKSHMKERLDRQRRREDVRERIKGGEGKAPSILASQDWGFVEIRRGGGGVGT